MQLPTDNLYKFMALSGLAIIVFTSVYTRSKVDETTEHIIETGRSIGEIAIRIEHNNSRLDLINDSISQYKDLNEPEKIRPLKLEAIALVEGLGLLNNENVSQQKRSDELVKRDQRQIGYLLVAYIIGLILTALGFTLWYSKVQQYIDIKTKNESNNSE